ncbi:hypothetical protein [Thiomicrorhabdus sp.]|uniref:hypothetical protein n=1 Tax=Thiomicrorhabdus sp. TaxID=2039724 RepID=UPI0029C8AC8D|nr:hypothetical protein [Thiomicrorhabdus sp.]
MWGPLFTVLMNAGKWLLGTVLVQGLIVGIIKIAIGIGLAQLFAILAIGAITYQGTAFTLDWVTGQMLSAISSLPSWQQDILIMVGSNLYVDEILTVIFTAYATVLALWTFNGAWTVLKAQFVS